MKRKEVIDKLDRIALFLICERIDHALSPGYWEACMAALFTVQAAQKQVKDESNTQPSGN